MSRYHSYLNTATTLLQVYGGEEPFGGFVKKFFSLHKKFGSRDRKTIVHLCYCYFRLGKAANDLPVDERILLALFLCSDEPNETLEALNPEWNRQVALPVKQKLLIAQQPFSVTAVFPWKEDLSNGINHEKYCESFFIQPAVFIRIRPGRYGAIVRQKLLKAGIPYTEMDDDCLALPSASKIEEVLALDDEAVIQDLNSQKTSSVLRAALANSSSPAASVWDCCAGSGGKSLLLFDLNDQVDIFVSDIRESIISNLKKRFAAHGIKKFKTLVADLTKPNSKITSPSKFDLIVCDAPCTGSGTWSRSPEQLYFFNDKPIGEFSDLQKRIASNVIPCLKAGGSFIYITCSVFKKENEDVVSFIEQNCNLKMMHMEVLKGYDKKADTMFVAMLQSPL